jgi:hypothetical protein
MGCLLLVTLAEQFKGIDLAKIEKGTKPLVLRR